jgi:hypothetical protein
MAERGSLNWYRDSTPEQIRDYFWERERFGKEQSRESFWWGVATGVVVTGLLLLVFR